MARPRLDQIVNSPYRSSVQADAISGRNGFIRINR